MLISKILAFKVNPFGLNFYASNLLLMIFLSLALKSYLMCVFFFSFAVSRLLLLCSSFNVMAAYGQQGLVFDIFPIFILYFLKLPYAILLIKVLVFFRC